MGNKMGWVIAGILVLAVAAFVIYSFVLAPGYSKPDPKLARASMMALQQYDVPVVEVTGVSPDASGNAGEDYNAAVELCRQHADDIREAADIKADLASGSGVVNTGTLEVLKKIRDHLAAGGRKAQMQYSFQFTPQKLEVGWFYKPAEDLFALHDAMQVLKAYHFGRKEFAQAVEVMKNSFLLGWHMVRESPRVRVDMTYKGLYIQASAVEEMRTIYATEAEALGQKDLHAKELQTLLSVRSTLDAGMTDIENKKGYVWSLKFPAGNLFYTIQNDKDRAWRVQALMGLGAVRFMYPGAKADQQRVQELLEEYAKSGDPVLAAAAQAAQQLTEPEFRTLGLK